MSTVERVMDATPAAVFTVLAEGWLYSNWVVGTSHVRAVDAGWPEPGARLRHASGAWPMVISDVTTVLSVTADERLELSVRGWPLGEARVSMQLEPAGSGQTSVTLTERAVSGLGRLLDNAVGEALITRRNVESLERLAAIAERRSPSST